jgi:hypothetical protein
MGFSACAGRRRRQRARLDDWCLTLEQLIIKQCEVLPLHRALRLSTLSACSERITTHLPRASHSISVIRSP